MGLHPASQHHHKEPFLRVAIKNSGKEELWHPSSAWGKRRDCRFLLLGDKQGRPGGREDIFSLLLCFNLQEEALARSASRLCWEFCHGHCWLWEGHGRMAQGLRAVTSQVGL